MRAAQAGAPGGGGGGAGEEGWGMVPEDVGKRAACALLEEVQRGGVVDGSHQASLHFVRTSFLPSLV